MVQLLASKAAQYLSGPRHQSRRRIVDRTVHVAAKNRAQPELCMRGEINDLLRPVDFSAYEIDVHQES